MLTILALLHFGPFEQKGIALAVSFLLENVNFDQYFWCCRGFLEGMKVCNKVCHEAGREVTYCGYKCQKAAYKIHKRVHEQMGKTAKGGADTE